MNIIRITLAALAAFGIHGAAQADWVTTSSSGSPVLSTCNPKTGSPATQSATLTTCKVDGLPGSAAVPGYILKASRSAPIIVNSVTVGTLYDRVYCKGTGTTCDATNTYILATRANLNTAVWSPLTTESFEINDYFRAIRSTVGADIAYFMGTVDGGTSADTALARKYLEYSGRTLKGLGEYTGSPSGLNPTRSNGWIDFRVDTNANDPDAVPPYSYSSPWSPWLFVRQTCSNGYTTTAQSQSVRLWQGGEEEQPPQAILTSGYRCNA
ncbi:hypothetical protein [Derxia gummosa]|uniref:Uncharacterized protein n=1 Tax=Derxia gummosa DSM 723 TaxID=1121388 RepID=A0A8B6X6J6_9BURK|nr:hypothetical protein [Derxia gummosa]